MAAHMMLAQSSRVKAMTIPREHGAWGMILVPLSTGALVASRSGANAASVALFLGAALSLFWLRTPLEAWLGTSAIKAQTAAERTVTLRMIAFTGAVALANGVLLIARHYVEGLSIIAIVALAAFAAQAGVKKLGRKGRMPAQIIGAIGLTSTAAGAYYVASGRLDGIAAGLWAANWLFAAGQIHFVQVRIHSSRAANLKEKMQQGWGFLVGQMAVLAALLAGTSVHLFPRTIVLAFVPVLLRGAFWFIDRPRPLGVHRLGLTELAHSVLFGGLLFAAYGL